MPCRYGGPRDLRHLRYFVAVQTGSLTVAADLAAAEWPHKIAAKQVILYRAEIRKGDL
jgi:hypothetical protein